MSIRSLVLIIIVLALLFKLNMGAPMEVARLKTVDTNQEAVEWINRNATKIKVFAVTTTGNGPYSTPPMSVTIWYYTEHYEEDSQWK